LRRFFALLASVLVVYCSLAGCVKAQTIVNVGTCVPTPSGVVNTKFCVDGDDGTAGIPLLWSTIPSFVNKIEGTPFSVNVCSGYLTQAGSPNATISNIGASLPTGWSLSGTDNCTLGYSGTGTGSAVVILRATRSSVTSDSNAFQVESVPDLAADATAPTVVTGVEVVLDGNNDPVIAFDAAADVRVAGADVSGVSTFTVRRGATPLTPTAYTGSASVPTFTTATVGTAVGANAVQDGADWSQTAEGGTPTAGSNFVFTYAEVTGDFTATVKVASVTGGSDSSRGPNLLVREGTAAGDRHFALHLFPSFNVRGYTRSVTDGSVVQAGVVALDSFDGWIRITREGNVVTGYASNDGNDFGVVGVPQTLGFNQTLLVGIATQSNQAGTATTVEYENLAVTTRPRQTYTDTSGVPGSSSYTVVSTDVQGNVSAASVAVVAPDVPAGSGSDTPDYEYDESTGLTLSLTNVPLANNAALEAWLATDVCGQRGVAANGVYNGNKTINGDCPASNPIVVECATIGGCTSTGMWTMTGRSNILEGFQISGGIVCRGNRNKVISNRFIGTVSSPAIQLEAVNSPSVDFGCEIAYNYFSAPGTSCLSTFKQAIKMNASNAEQTVQLNVWIHHNHFENWITSCDQGDIAEMGETGTVSWAETSRSGIRFEYNLIDGFSAGDSGLVFDGKVGGYVARYNTVINSGVKGISQRVGQASIIESNYMTGGAMIIVTNADAIVVCNVVSTIRVRAGNQNIGTLANGHTRARNTHVASNIGTLINGWQASDAYNISADLTKLENHTGSYSEGLASNLIDNRNGPATRDCAAAVELLSSQVGPNGISLASSGYRSGRDL
jgi:hypothetical protein